MMMAVVCCVLQLIVVPTTESIIGHRIIHVQACGARGSSDGLCFVLQFLFAMPCGTLRADEEVQAHFFLFLAQHIAGGCGPLCSKPLGLVLRCSVFIVVFDNHCFAPVR